ALARLTVGPPAQERRGVTKAMALEVVVFHLAHALDAQRLPRQVLAAAPAALAAGHARGLLPDVGPLRPWVSFQRVLAQRRELVHERPPLSHLERRRDADVLQLALVIVEPKEQRAHRITRVLVPPEARHYTIRSTRVLDLDHCTLAGLVNRVER